MHTPTTCWDRGPTDAELNAFYGKDIERNAADEYVQVLTKDVRKVSIKNLSLDYVRTEMSGRTVIAQYTVAEAINDYMDYDKPMAALMAVFEKSDCPLVAALRQAVADEFARHNAEELDIARSEA